MKIVCFDGMVFGASLSAPEAELITTKCQKNISKLTLVLHLPAKNFKEIVKTNVIQN